MNTTFRTHTGEIITGNRLTDALNQVADRKIESAKKIRLENLYAPHVTEKQKEDNMLRAIERAEQVRTGINLNSLSIWQDINTVLTGECIALLP